MYTEWHNTSYLSPHVSLLHQIDFLAKYLEEKMEEEKIRPVKFIRFCNGCGERGSFRTVSLMMELGRLEIPAREWLQNNWPKQNITP